MVKNKTYQTYHQIFKDQPLPAAFVDMDLLDENIHAILKRAGSKKMRIASKSIRCRYIMEYILASNTSFEGVMCYSAGEAAWLAEEGFDNLLIGYPSMNKVELGLVADQVKLGKRIYPMIDDLDQAVLLNKIGEEKGIVFKTCIDIDMSTDFPGIHFGVYRSPLHTLTDVKKLVEKLKSLPHISISGVMGYEAQTAGTADRQPGEGLKNAVIKILKKRSNKDYTERRKEIVSWLTQEGYVLEIVNAGGTGSIESSSSEPWVTEVTVGSGFYSPGLFDHYSGFKHLPAMGFVLQIVRVPRNRYFTCSGGGYIASGKTGALKQPYPYLPEGIKPIKYEGFGEVQTPFVYDGNIPLKIGDPVLFRHAKAGELCEHFNYLSVLKKDNISAFTTTYRGDGKSFL